jgi:hypothetical protein
LFNIQILSFHEHAFIPVFNVGAVAPWLSVPAGHTTLGAQSTFPAAVFPDALSRAFDGGALP